MKPFAHVTWLALGLSLAGLMTGCVSSDYRTAQRIEPASDIEVVETSARRPLTAKEMAELRGTVARYLDQQGQNESGDYYLKVYLTPDDAGVTPEWVVVRFTRYTDTRVAVIGTYPVDNYPYSSSYYSYDAYPYGYDNFSRIAFQYYDDPFYGRRYYYPRHDHRDRDRDHDHDHHRRDEDHKSDGGRPPGGVATDPPPRAENPRHHTPDRIAPSSQPRPEMARRTRSEDNNAGTAGRPVSAGTSSRPVNPATLSRPVEPDRQWRGRYDNSGNPNSAPRTPPPPRAEARNETRTYAPPPRVQPEQRSAPDNSNDRREVRDDGKRQGNQP